MKKCFCFILAVCLLVSAGCTGKKPWISETYFYFDTAVTLSADCSLSVLQGAFDLCAHYEALFSRTKEGSDVWRINHSRQPVTVDSETAALIKTALSFCELTDGRFDITIAPVSALYDFGKGVMPSEAQIAKALQQVDYRQIRVSDNTVCLPDGELDLGAIAKGYVADRLVEYFKEHGVDNANINLGGNLYVIGEEQEVGIKQPFSRSLVLTALLTDISLSTSGIDQRSFEHDGVIEHHVLDPQTGHGVQNELAQVTVLSTTSAQADAFSTICMLLGYEKSSRLIRETRGIQAVWIFRDGTVRVSDGLAKEGDRFSLVQG